MGTEQEGKPWEGVATVVVDIVFAFREEGGDKSAPDLRRFTHGSAAFGHDETLSRGILYFLRALPMISSDLPLE